MSRINYLAQYPLQSCLIQDGSELVSDRLEGFDFITGQVIAERVNWSADQIQVCLKSLIDLTEVDLTRLANLFLAKNNSGDTLSYPFRQVKPGSLVVTPERVHLQYEDGTYFFVYTDGSGVGFISEPADFPLPTRWWDSEIVGVNDLLHQLGYATPYLQYSVQDLVALGWLVLK